MPESKFLTNREAAELLRIKPNTLTIWRNEGRIDIPWARLGKRRVLYKRSDVEAYIEKNRCVPSRIKTN